MVILKYRKFVQTGRIDVLTTTSTTSPFSAVFDDVPRVFLQVVSASTACLSAMIDPGLTTTADFTAHACATCTCDWLAVYTTE